MFKKGFVPIVIVLIITLLAAGGITSYLFIKNKPPKIIGGDTDSHGCLISAGYSWCEAKQKCLRTWEESCDETTTTISTTTTTTTILLTTTITSTLITATTTTKPSTTTTTINKLNKRAVVIVYKNVYDSLKLDIDNFQKDVATNLGVEINIIQLQDSLSFSPLDIRNLLIKECQLDGVNGCSNLEGAVLVGDIPYALYEQVYDGNHLAPFMYFYEDLDASFKQNDLGHYYGYDGYGLHGGSEIYTGWIRSTFLATDFNNYINELRAYFQKHHNFFTKQTIPSNRAVSAIHVPNYNYPFSIPNLGLTIYGTNNSINIMPDIADNLAPFKPALLAEFSKGPEVAYLHSHGGPTEVWGLTASDLSGLTNLPLFTLTWGCTNGNFMENQKDSIALAFIHGKNLGLSFLGKLDSTDIDVYSGNCPNCGWFLNNQVDFFRYLNKGQYVGEAWLNVEHDFADYKNSLGEPVGNLYKLSGPLQRIIIGSPFIYIPTARK
ncbi:MAG: hypothetical protein WC306_00500 [Candidatus Paceibacterota bacterium]|jgi:hypothetical protein